MVRNFAFLFSNAPRNATLTSRSCMNTNVLLLGVLCSRSIRKTLASKAKRKETAAAVSQDDPDEEPAETEVGDAKWSRKDDLELVNRYVSFIDSHLPSRIQSRTDEIDHVFAGLLARPSCSYLTRITLALASASRSHLCAA